MFCSNKIVIKTFLGMISIENVPKTCGSFLPLLNFSVSLKVVLEITYKLNCGTFDSVKKVQFDNN